MLRSLASAFLMYSRIPMPKVEWKEENRRYALCFFPFIGAVIGVLFCMWFKVCGILQLNDMMKGAVAMLIPVSVTGGIHLDGFSDVSDARASWGDREKKLAIMKDSHIGAFAAIKLCVYLILQTAVFSQINEVRTVIMCGLCFMLSRTLSGLAAVTFRAAKSDGTLQSFVKPSHKRITLAMLISLSVFICSAMIVISPLCGITGVAAAISVFLYYRHMAYKEFGGTTGDIAGWFLQLEELIVPIAIVISERIAEVCL